MMRHYFFTSFILAALVGPLNPMAVMAATGEEEMPPAWQLLYRQDMSVDPAMLRQMPLPQQPGWNMPPLGVQPLHLGQQMPVSDAMYPAPSATVAAVSPATTLVPPASSYPSSSVGAGLSFPELDEIDFDGLDALLSGSDTSTSAVQPLAQASSADPGFSFPVLDGIDFGDVDMADLDALLSGSDTSTSAVQPLAQASSVALALNIPDKAETHAKNPKRRKTSISMANRAIKAEARKEQNRSSARKSRARQKRELEALKALAEINPDVKGRRDLILLGADVDAAALQVELQPQIDRAKKAKNRLVINKLASRISRVRKATIELRGLYEACEREGYFNPQ